MPGSLECLRWHEGTRASQRGPDSQRRKSLARLAALAWVLLGATTCALTTPALPWWFGDGGASPVYRTL